MAASFAIAALLFAPLAASLHACPGMGDMAAAMQAMADGGAPMDVTLCEHHCNDGKVSFDLAQPAPAAAMPVVPALRVAALEPVSVRAPAFDSPYSSASGPAPPLIGFAVLLI